MQKASRSNQRDALIMIYSFNYGQYHLYFLISIPIHTVPKISTDLFYLQRAIHMVLELVHACSIRDEPIHVVLELVQACSICNEPIHMVPKLVQTCSICN